MINITGSNVTIMVKDMDRSISFYEQLGMTLKQRWGDNYAMVSAEGITLGIHPSHGAEGTSGSVSIGLMIENIEEAKAILNAANVASIAIQINPAWQAENFK
jgi:predicted enzyme related to lactoylglutathione lyase